MVTKLLLACDLDRTVLPNGPELLSAGALEEFAQFVQRPGIHLAYASGRSLELIQQAINEFGIPVPDAAIGDVGTTIYTLRAGQFTVDEGWSDVIALDWQGVTGEELHAQLQSISGLRLQETSKQNRFKLSYYVPEQINQVQLIVDVQTILKPQNINAAVIFSIDQMAHTGLLDIIPASATKQGAIEYVRAKLGLSLGEVVYAGDSGNDLEPLTAGYNAILVNNALPEIKTQVEQLAQVRGVSEKIYYAHGGYHGMNGNYVAGILEGLQHYGFDSH